MIERRGKKGRRYEPKMYLTRYEVIWVPRSGRIREKGNGIQWNPIKVCLSLPPTAEWPFSNCRNGNDWGGFVSDGQTDKLSELHCCLCQRRTRRFFHRSNETQGVWARMGCKAYYSSLPLINLSYRYTWCTETLNKRIYYKCELTMYKHKAKGRDWQWEGISDKIVETAISRFESGPSARTLCDTRHIIRILFLFIQKASCPLTTTHVYRIFKKKV